jgi:CRP/FNR family cyclic AMP-dependent transcriptional regulator
MLQVNAAKGFSSACPFRIDWWPPCLHKQMGLALNTQSMSTNMPREKRAFNPHDFLTTVGLAKSITQCQPGHQIFLQGDPSDAVFYILKGRVRLTTSCAKGKQVIIALLGKFDFLGEACLAGQKKRVSSATAIMPSSILRIEGNEMRRMLQKEPALSGVFISHLLSRNMQIELDLVDQLVSSSEKRLARTLLYLARHDSDGKHETAISHINQETLAEMIGVTRERVNFLMNKFRKLGFIEYTHRGMLTIHRSLLIGVLRE